MKKSKILTLVLCAVLLVATTVIGTVAFLTDRESVTNTFTVGNVDITVDEAQVTPDGKPVDGADRVKENKYHLIPGMTYTKDPMMTVTADSEAAYVRMKVTITYKADADAVFAKYGVNNWVNINSNDWAVTGVPVTSKDDAAGTISRTYEFRYKEVVAKNTEATELPKLFTTLSVPGDVNNTEIAHLSSLNITVEGHAIQAATFNDADAAWDAFDNQMNSTNP